MKTVVALVGDFYQKEELALESLLKALAERIAAAELQVHFAADTDSLIAALGNAPDAVILFAEDRVSPIAQPESKWMTSAVSDQIVRYVEISLKRSQGDANVGGVIFLLWEHEKTQLLLQHIRHSITIKTMSRMRTRSVMLVSK